ncbi:PepSY domain-containing protein [Microbacterium amylolyticum]|uniref:Membrane protein YkoI n=1 Tax=Microbacterium amylolyticum TaxID=936337 RepID=A0ABS4ZF45_9MICO|nr:PepSY domain-containing protein [Microbacterium amylolyticum]MBP2435911.1 putative membrane protein YkoI [Microbacterium amylolyticum]
MTIARLLRGSAITSVALATALSFTSCGQAGIEAGEEVTTSENLPSSERTTRPVPSTEPTDPATPADERSTPESPAETTGPETNEEPFPAILQAIGIAESGTGGKAYEIDDEDRDGIREIDVAVGDRSVEVTVDAAEGRVVRTEDDGGLSDNDAQGLAQATVTLAEAIAIALTAHDGVIDDAELDDDDGRWYWDISIDLTGGGSIDVLVDTVTGEVTVD